MHPYVNEVEHSKEQIEFADLVLSARGHTWHVTVHQTYR